MPSNFIESDFIFGSQEMDSHFLMTGVIAQNRKNDKEIFYYLSDFLVDKTNNTWFLINSKSAFKNFAWAEMWKEIMKENQIPLVLLFSK